MKSVVLIGKLDDATKEIGNCISKECQVQICSEDQNLIMGMLLLEPPDLIVVALSGSAVFAKDMFNFLLPYEIPILGIGSASDKAELFINGYLSSPKAAFLEKPAAPADIIRAVRQLGRGEDAEQGAGEEEPVYSEEEKAVTQNATILLVDDSPAFLRAMQAILSTRYKVAFATSAVQAIVSITKNRPDLILLDYEMPICDGRMTLRMLRAEEDMKDIPVVFLTGISDARHVSDVMALHPEGYLLKPCPDNTVFSMIEKVLRERGTLDGK